MLLLAACGGGESTKVARDGDTVSVHYRGTLDSGEEFDSSRGREPLSFELGSGGVIPGFDAAVQGLAVGDTVTVRLEPEDAYGERSDDLILEFPISQLPEGVGEGDQIVFQNGAPGVILDITDAVVRIDANHPLAGEALTFEIELVSIQ
ncbi:MAG: peptidylprolyl isomerase [Chloroflexi bacterium]|nr:peptidylprolyl isomerase [Chloroflexota bacterium]